MEIIPPQIIPLYYVTLHNIRSSVNIIPSPTPTRQRREDALFRSDVVFGDDGDIYQLDVTVASDGPRVQPSGKIHVRLLSEF